MNSEQPSRLRLSPGFLKTLMSARIARYGHKERAVLLSLVLGFAGLFPGALAMVLSGSMTLFSNLLENGSLVLGILFSWLGVKKVSQARSHGYNYGYGKMENLSSLVVAAVMIISLAIIGYHTYERFRHPIMLNEVGTLMGIAFSAIAVCINAWLWHHARATARRETSPIMESLWRLDMVKTVSASLVLVSLSLSTAFRTQQWAAYADPVGSVILGGIIVFSIHGIISKSVYDLMDQTLEESLQLVILRKLAGHFSEYEALHGIRSRRSGSSIFIEIFLEFDGERKMGDIQQAIDRMRSELEQEIANAEVIIAPMTVAVV